MALWKRKKQNVQSHARASPPAPPSTRVFDVGESIRTICKGIQEEEEEEIKRDAPFNIHRMFKKKYILHVSFRGTTAVISARGAGVLFAVADSSLTRHYWDFSRMLLRSPLFSPPPSLLLLLVCTFSFLKQEENNTNRFFLFLFSKSSSSSSAFSLFFAPTHKHTFCFIILYCKT